MSLQKPGDPIATLIPYNNSKALMAYYLGLFSILPALGLPMGIVAIVFGLQGLRLARENPESKGKVHAGIGIGCGLVGALFNAAIIALIVVALLNQKPPTP